MAWVVRHPVPGERNRRTRYFKADQKAQAEAFLKERLGLQKSHGMAASLEDEEIWAVNATREQREGLGYSAGEAFAFLLRFAPLQARLRELGSDLEAAARETLERLGRNRSPMTVLEAIAGAAEQKVGSVKSKGLRNFRSRLARLEKDFGGRDISGIEPGPLRDWIMEQRMEDGRPLGNRSRDDMRGAIHDVFEYALLHRACERNIVKEIRRFSPPNRKRKGKVGILAPGEMRRLLDVSPDELVPALVLGGFCGLRNEEIIAIEPENDLVRWENIHLKKGYLKVPDASKTGERTVHLEPNAIEWLRKFEKAHGPVAPVPGRWRELWRGARRDSGIKQWPRNALRHSYGSYYMAKRRDLGACAENMGNSPAVVKRDYQEVVEPEEAVSWWAILPP